MFPVLTSITSDDIITMEMKYKLKPTFMVFFCGWLSGDTDGRVPVLSTRYSLSALGLPINKAWSPWYHQKQVISYYHQPSLQN